MLGFQGLDPYQEIKVITISRSDSFVLPTNSMPETANIFVKNQGRIT
jgi:hypothetical protein